ncbi:helix-turn-helix domain-containing protein [Eubacteriales bacterium OttesenSCG-928-A19]|nr:helix-turn-helix domain-containing protein [Eubacteriales bacterium OttesenSCG-928-A19]
MFRAVIVDDDKWALEDIKQSFAFETHGFVLEAAFASAEDALVAILRSPPDLIVSDIRMQRNSGLDMVRILREHHVASVFVLVSGYDDFAYAQIAFRYGVFDYLLKPIDDEQVHDLMHRIRAHLEKHGGDQTPAYSADIVGEALRYIDAHYARSMSLEELAANLHMNKNHLSQLISKRIGMPFTQYKNTLRIQRAKELIQAGETSLTNIAYAVGFDSLSRFSKVFKQLTCLSPQQYKKALLRPPKDGGE